MTLALFALTCEHCECRWVASEEFLEKHPACVWCGADTVRRMSDDYQGTCPFCGSPHWVSASLDEGWTRIPQCVPCGALHRHTLGPGWRQLHLQRGREIRAEKRAAAQRLPP